MILLSDSNGMSFMTVLFLLVIMSIAGTTGYMAIMPVVRERNSSITMTRMEVLAAAVVVYRAQHAGTSPPGLNDLVTANLPACTVDTTVGSATYRQKTGWCGPYIDRPVSQNLNEFQNDGWNTLFQYNLTTLTSCGPNRGCGDADDVTISF